MSRRLGVEATIEGEDLTEKIVDAVFHVLRHRGRRVELNRTRRERSNVAADVFRDEHRRRVAVDAAEEVHAIVGSLHAERLQTRQTLLGNAIHIADLRLDLLGKRDLDSYGDFPGKRTAIRSSAEQQRDRSRGEATPQFDGHHRGVPKPYNEGGFGSKRLMEEVMQVPRTRSTSIPSPMWMVSVEEELAEWKERAIQLIKSV